MDEVSEQDAEDSCAEANPLGGTKIRLMAVNILTKAKTDFTKVKFMPAEMSASDAAALHKEETGAAASAATSAA